MYSPRIKDDLIPVVYRLARQEGKPMTRLVDEILRAEIERRCSQRDPHPDSDILRKPKKNS
jgi:hypothetical protein